MASPSFFKRLAAVSVGALCFAAPSLPRPCLAEALSVSMPPLGYTGPVVSAAQEKADQDSSVPPVGYVGPVSRQAVVTPPLGYTGPAPAAVVSPKAEPQKVAVQNGASAKETQADKNKKETLPRKETLITASHMKSNDENGILTAQGRVEIVRENHILRADRVDYNRVSGVMTAEGNVELLMPSGEVEFADRQEVTADMKQAYGRNVGILMPDNSRMAASVAQRYDERYMKADHALYTACNVCKENPDIHPLWQLRAENVTHDNVEHEIYYRDATVEFADVPIFYTPYISMPDPTVSRRQGFLTLSPGYSSSIGSFVKTPYYVDIAPEKDLTISPTFSENDKAQLDLQYRQRFAKSNLIADGSFTRADLVNSDGIDKGEQWRGHFFGKFLYNVDDIWRVGADAQYSSDKSYLNRYRISSLDQLTNRAYAEAFKGRDYFSINSYYFQDLRPDTNASQPFVLPSATLSLLGNPGQTWGGRWSFDANTLATVRDNSGKALTDRGADTRRLSTNLGWERQLISNTGLVTQVSGLVRSDSYWADGVVSSDGSTLYDQSLFTRTFTQGNAVFRYPMGRAAEGYQHLIEPVVAFTAAPTVRRSAKQPIEDSYEVEFDETNLFSPNRFTGSDLIEGGSRVTYGLRNAVTMDSGARIDFFGGQSYSFDTNNSFPDASGLGGHASDYVGRVDFSPVKWFNMNYGARFSQKDFEPMRQDALISAGNKIFSPSMRYIEAYQSDTSTGVISRVRQVSVGLSSNFTKYWTLTAYHTQAFDPQPGPRGTNVGLAYVDECYAFGVSASHDYTTRADVSSGTSVVFHFFLKNLGGIYTDAAHNISFPAEFRQTD